MLLQWHCWRHLQLPHPAVSRRRPRTRSERCGWGGYNGCSSSRRPAQLPAVEAVERQGSAAGVLAAAVLPVAGWSAVAEIELACILGSWPEACYLQSSAVYPIVAWNMALKFPWVKKWGKKESFEEIKLRSLGGRVAQKLCENEVAWLSTLMPNTASKCCSYLL